MTQRLYGGKEIKPLELMMNRFVRSEEDVYRTKCLIESIKSGLSIRFELRDEFINWIESFKKRIGEQQ